MSAEANVFRLARLSPPIRWLSVALPLLPVAFLASSLAGTSVLALPGFWLVGIYAWMWSRLRPARFVIWPHAVEAIWPLRRARIPGAGFASARLVDGEPLRRMTGWRVRLGAGGLWGGIGWLWTQKRGPVRMYVSRTDGLVWNECHGARPRLITPKRPDAFAAPLAG